MRTRFTRVIDLNLNYIEQERFFLHDLHGQQQRHTLYINAINAPPMKPSTKPQIKPIIEPKKVDS